MAPNMAHNNVAAILKQFKEQLKGRYSDGEIETFVRLALEHYSGLNFSNALLNPDIKIRDELILLYQNTITKLAENQPIQYILGRTEFYGLWFNVSPAVLIPRPETEEIVHHIITENQSAQGLQVIDYCTGSGCIAVTLAKHLKQAVVSAVDVSAPALAVAQQNAANNNAAVSFIQADVLNSIMPFATESIDVIVSNPPYVPQAELAEMAANVKDYEPHLALFVPDNDPLLFYKKISTLAKAQLKSGGKLYFECHINHATGVVDLLDGLGFKNSQIVADFTGRNRLVKAQK